MWRGKLMTVIAIITCVSSFYKFNMRKFLGSEGE